MEQDHLEGLGSQFRKALVAKAVQTQSLSPVLFPQTDVFKGHFGKEIY